VGAVFFDIDNIIDEVNRAGSRTKHKKSGNHGDNCGGRTPEMIFGKNQCAKNKGVFDPLTRAHGTN
jgi:hypothetical protein